MNEKGGIDVPGTPHVMVRKISKSVGNEDEFVERNLNLATVKSLGLGSKPSADGPCPSPFSPWQTAQSWRYSFFPRSTNSGEAAIGLCAAFARSASTTSFVAGTRLTWHFEQPVSRENATLP